MERIAQWSLLAVVSTLGLVACEQRGDLAPVVESNWRAMAHHSAYHVVVRGETLYSIAFRYDEDYRKLAQLNHLEAPYLLRVGQKVYLKPTMHRATVAKYTTVKAAPRPVPPPSTRLGLAQRVMGYTVFGTSRWNWPARGKIVTPFLPQQGKKGIDIAGHQGDKIRAAASGVVAYAGSGLSGYGNLIIIKHHHQYLTAYGNNAKNLVREGQQIKAGQVIADMGIVNRRYWGVHFEIRKAGLPVNPMHYLQKG